MTNLTHWKKLENPDYIGAYAFQPNEKKTLTIAKAARDMVHGVDGKKEQCTLVYWKENEKPLILNATNGKMITKVTGTPFIEQWPGNRIVLGVEKVKAWGDVVDAVRVKNEKPGAAKADEAPRCADCNQIVTDSGGYKAASIVSAAMKQFGVVVCMDCAGKRKTAPPPDEREVETDAADEG